MRARPIPSVRPPALAATLLALALLAGAGGAPAAEPFRQLVQGAAPPEFTLPDTAGRPVRLADLRGRAILLTFVSCYTDTCLAPVNAFEALLARVGPARLVAVSVCAEVPAALKRDGYAGLLSRCSGGQTILVDESQTVADRYAVTQFPTSVLVAPDFTVREVLQGVAALRDPGLPGRIEALAASAVPAGPAP